MEYDQIVSLGGRCQVAYQIRRRFAALERAHILDWLLSPMASVTEAVRDGFEAMVNGPSWVDHHTNAPFFKHRHVMCHPYGLLSTHEFDNTRPSEEDLPSVLQKYRFLLDRWNTLMSAGQSVLFIHQVMLEPQSEGMPEVPATADAVRNLHAALSDRYPALKFDLLILTDRDAPLVGVGSPALHYTVPQTVPWNWGGDNDEWDRMWPALGIGLRDAETRQQEAAAAD